MQLLVIDDHRFSIEFAGFSRPLRARGSDPSGPVLELPPWRCADHLEQLRVSLRMGSEGFELDAERYADGVLARASREPEDPEPWRRLALWWGSGREPDGRREPPSRVNDVGKVGLDGKGTVATLRPWTWGERLIGEGEHLHGGPDEALEFDAVGYLEAMVEGCLVELCDHAGRSLDAEAWRQLDAQATRRLLGATVELNHPAAEGDPLSALSPALAASTLRLCAALGWSPQRVLAQPAAEVQRMLMLLDKIDDAPRSGARAPARAQPVAPRRRSSIADHPDAVVIHFVDDDVGGGG